MHTKKVGSVGRFRAGYGKKPKEKILKIEKKQRRKQICPHCKKPAAKRIAKGIWLCSKCGKKFTSGSYYIEM